MTEKKRTLRPTSKTAWARGNDSGPHLAALPSGAVVKFRVPDQGALLRAGRLPTELREAAIIFTSHPDGTDDLMRELVITAALRGPGQDTLASVIQAGRELVPHLVAEMLLEPSVTQEEVEAGVFPELDIRMLLEFAERLRNTDAQGNELAITTMDEWATFRREHRGARGAGNGGASEPVADGAVPDADLEEV
jgi:hypothetical protein